MPQLIPASFFVVAVAKLLLAVAQIPRRCALIAAPGFLRNLRARCVAGRAFSRAASCGSNVSARRCFEINGRISRRSRVFHVLVHSGVCRNWTSGLSRIPTIRGNFLILDRRGNVAARRCFLNSTGRDSIAARCWRSLFLIHSGALRRGRTSNGAAPPLRSDALGGQF